MTWLTISTLFVGVTFVNSINTSHRDPFSVPLYLAGKPRGTEWLKWTSVSQCKNSLCGWKTEEKTFSLTKADVKQSFTAVKIASVQNVSLKAMFYSPVFSLSNTSFITINIEFSIRKCIYDVVKRAPQKYCTESFKLFFGEYNNTSDANKYRSNIHTYREVATLTASKKFDGSLGVSADKRYNQSASSTLYTKSRFARLMLFDEGVAGEVRRISVNYKACPRSIVSLAVFPETKIIPKSYTSVPGQCVPGAEHDPKKPPPHNICFNGWHHSVTNPCVCSSGQQPVGDQGCEPCRLHYYKTSSGNHECVVCPKNALTYSSGNNMCVCDVSYYRPSQALDTACKQIPPPPTNMRIKKTDDSTAVLTWKPPQSRPLFRGEYYHLLCLYNCKHLTFSSGNKTKSTQTKIYGLEPNISYIVEIYIETNAVDTINSSAKAQLLFSTQPQSTSGVHVENVCEHYVNKTTVNIHWRTTSAEYVKVWYYEVRLISKRNAPTIFFFPTNSVLCLSGIQFHLYFLKIRALVNKRWSPWSTKKQLHGPQFFINTVNTATIGSKSFMGSTTAAVAAVGICVVIALAISAIGCIFYRKIMTKQNISRSSSTANLITQLFRGEGLGTSKIIYYSEPCDGENEILDMQLPIIEPEDVNILEKVGSGNFGDVCRGVLRREDNSKTIVAVKSLRDNALSENCIDFTNEAKRMIQFDSKFVIKMIGVVKVKTYVTQIITEFMSNGALDKYVSNNVEKLCYASLMEMLLDVAEGMCYLSSIGFVHRDLAARNILVSADRTCKVADFGLSRSVDPVFDNDGSGSVTERKSQIPIRWTSPEALKTAKFDEASDVWSFGILVWETMSYGKKPYYYWPENAKVEAEVSNGHRLPSPANCPKTACRLMRNCWLRPPKRLNFQAIVYHLRESIDDQKHAQKTLAQSYGTVKKLLHVKPPIQQWLETMNVDNLYDAFRRQGITSANELAKFNDSLHSVIDLTPDIEMLLRREFAPIQNYCTESSAKAV